MQIVAKNLHIPLPLATLLHLPQYDAILDHYGLITEL